MCPDTFAGTLAIAAAPALHFVRAIQSALDLPSCHPDLCSFLRQLMWRYRATTYRLIQCSHRYEVQVLCPKSQLWKLESQSAKFV